MMCLISQGFVQCALAKILHLFDWFNACGVITLMVQISFWWLRNILISGNGWHTLRHVLYLGGKNLTYRHIKVE